jgi:ATP-dependent Clp protease ATP-binding subunit ClpA
VFERFTADGRSAVEDAVAEARRLGHRRVGTEHLLLALLGTDTVAGRALAGSGVDRAQAEHDLQSLRAPDRPDAGSLEVLGIDLDEVKRRVDDAFGPGALERTTAWLRSGSGRPRFIPESKKALELALREALALGHRAVGSEHILLGMLRDRHTVALELLGRQGVAVPAIRTAVLEQLRRTA